jgi:hypothetical protein
LIPIDTDCRCAADLRDHDQFELRPGEFYDLRSLVRRFQSGQFQRMELGTPSASEIAQGQEALRELGPRIFSETEAGSWVLGPSVRR